MSASEDLLSLGQFLLKGSSRLPLGIINMAANILITTRVK